MNEEQLSELVARLDTVARVNRHTDNKTALWDRDDCAAYLKLSRGTLDKMIIRGEFCPARLSVTCSNKGDRWIPQDVIDWAMGRQFQPGKPRAA